MYVYIRTGVATVWEFRTYIYVRKSERVKNYRTTFDDVTDDVISRNVGDLLGDVIPLNLTDRL